MVTKYCTKCKTEHPVEMFTKNKNRKDGLAAWCKPCCKASTDEWRERNIDKCKERGRQAYLKDKQAYKDKAREWKRANRERVKELNKKNYDPEKRREYAAAYRQKNKDKRNAYNQEWLSAHPGWANAYAAKRRDAVRKASPTCMLPKDIAEIKGIYALAKKMTELTGQPYHVDHIVPIKGKDVCGLHVSWNLQVIPAVDNLKKSNRLAAALSA